MAKSVYWGVKLGNGCKFDGPMQFYKFPGSSILTGNDCRFNSLTIATQAWDIKTLQHMDTQLGSICQNRRWMRF